MSRKAFVFSSDGMKEDSKRVEMSEEPLATMIVQAIAEAIKTEGDRTNWHKFALKLDFMGKFDEETGAFNIANLVLSSAPKDAPAAPEEPTTPENPDRFMKELKRL